MMNGYSNQKLFNGDFVGASSTTRYYDYNRNASSPGPVAMNNRGLNPGGTGSGNLLPHHHMRGIVSTLSSTAIAQQQSQSQQQQQHQPLLYDMSSFDPLQAQALQLSASAGLTTAHILAAAAAPGTVSAHEGTAAEAKNNSSNTTATGIGVGISQPAHAYSQSLSQTQAPVHGTATSIAGTPVSISGGHLQPIQPVTGTTQAAPTQHPYIFIQPQQIASNGVVSAATSTFNASPVAATPSTLLVPTGTAVVHSGATQHTASTTAASLAASTQANAVAAAAAGLGTHPLLFNSAFLTAAAAQGVSGLTAPANSGQLLQPHHTQPSADTQQQAQRHHAHITSASALGPTLILPATINLHQTISQSHANSKKRSLGSGVLINDIAPSVVSSATAPLTESSKRQRVAGQSRKVNNAEASKAEDPAEKRRYERNLREQQRSSKISSQIKELREVLSDCNVPFKPNKYSILLKVVEYIKQLQSRAIMLDAEHQKLITTVRQTNEMITNAAKNNNGMSSTTCGATDNDSSDATCQDGWQQVDRMNAHPSRGGRGDSELCFVKGIDYRTVFEQCPIAFGIATLDGRILECNIEFQNLLGYSAREDLLKQSLFNLVHNHQDIFRAMAQMLKTAEEPPPKSGNTNTTSDVHGINSATDNSMDRFWTGPVTSKQNIELSMNITLTSGDNETPKFFTCALTNSIV